MIIQPISFLESKIFPKGWGEELHIVSNDLYCLKKLKFKAGLKFSCHFHFEKTETWLIEEGAVVLTYFDLSNADELKKTLTPGMIVHIPNGNPHQLYACTDVTITEVSTPDKKEDNYRIKKGESQTK